MSLSSGSYMLSRATLPRLTANCYCCVSHTSLMLMQLFPARNLTDLKVESGCSRSLECLPFVLVNNRQCKHHRTVTSLSKILSFKYFRESSLLKQVKRVHLRFRCKVLPMAAPNRMNPLHSLWKDLGKVKVVPARVKSPFWWCSGTQQLEANHIDRLNR